MSATGHSHLGCAEYTQKSSTFLSEFGSSMIEKYAYSPGWHALWIWSYEGKSLDLDPGLEEHNVKC